MRFDARPNNFDLIRLLLAALVIFSHSYLLANGNDNAEPFVIFTKGQATGGAIAVDFFFIISGFLVTASLERSASIASYFKKRVFRIYPAFIVSSVVSAVLVLPMAGGSFVQQSAIGKAADFAVRTVSLHLFHYVHVFANNPTPNILNGSIWTIQFEFLCYICLAVLGIIGMLRRNAVLCFLLFIFVALHVAAVIIPAFGGFAYSLALTRFAAVYLSGVIVYRLRSQIPLRTTWICFAVAFLIAGARIPYMWPVVFPFAGTYLIMAIAFHPSIRCHGFGRHGDFSYGTYLYAFPIQQLIVQSMGKGMPPAALFGMSTPVILMAAFLSWNLVERWFLRRQAALGRGAAG